MLPIVLCLGIRGVAGQDCAKLAVHIIKPQEKDEFKASLICTQVFMRLLCALIEDRLEA